MSSKKKDDKSRYFSDQLEIMLLKFPQNSSGNIAIAPLKIFCSLNALILHYENSITEPFQLIEYLNLTFYFPVKHIKHY